MRTRIYELPTGRWICIWEARRHFPSRAEALAAAEQPLPTAVVGPLRIAPGIVELAARLHDEARFSWEAVATALGEAGVPTPRGGPWRGGTISGAVRRAQAKRAEHDRRAVHSEWNVKAD